MEGDIEDVDVSPDGRRIAFTTNERGADVLRVADAASGRVVQQPSLPLGTIGGVEWHHDNRTLGFTLSSARSPSDVYSLDAASGEVTRWTYSELGGLAPEQLQEPRMISWKSFDGREITGFMTLPPKTFTGKRPVIVSIHGGPEGQSRPGFLARNNYYVNELGIALIYPNVRGSTGFGKSFAKLDNDTLRTGTYKDVAALFDWIATQPELDASKILVMGGSYGGHMVLATATQYPDRIAAAVDVVGISHLGTFLEHTEGYRRDLRRAEYGDERNPEIRAWMDRMAPLNNASKITKPLLVVQGANDPRVPRTEAEQIVGAVRKNQTPVWYLLAKNEGHGFAKKENADFQFYTTVTFIREFLLGGERTAMVP
jgi:dipeptidyl aminopeptidase/acylaminoacyl peptidase